MSYLIDIIGFLKTGNLIIVSAIYIVQLLISFLLMFLLIKKRKNIHSLELIINILLISCTLIGLFVFDKYYLLRIFVGAIMIIISIYTFIKFDKLLNFLRNEQQKNNQEN